MFEFLKRTMLALLVILAMAGSASAQSVSTFTKGLKVKGGLTVVSGAVALPSGVALSAGSLSTTGAISGGSTITAASGMTVTSGGLTVTAGGLTVSAGAVAVPSLSVTTPITNANIGNGAKRQILQFVANNGGSCADSTTYSALLIPGRAGVVKAIKFVSATPPVDGTDILLVKKGSSSGNTMLSAASVDATTMVANTVLSGTLTATSADLAVTATQPIYVAYTSGVQTTDAVGVGIQIEFEPDDY